MPTTSPETELTIFDTIPATRSVLTSLGRDHELGLRTPIGMAVSFLSTTIESLQDRVIEVRTLSAENEFPDLRFEW